MLVYNPSFQQELVDEAVKHAQKEWPNESCGYFTSESYVPCVNDAIDKELSFVINDKKFYDDMLNNKVKAVIHSHNSRQFSSATDQMKCDDLEIPYGIINLIDPDNVTHIIFWGNGIKKAPYTGRFFWFGVHDCLSLVCDYYKEKYKIKLPSPYRDFEFINNNHKFFEEYLEEVMQSFEKVELDDLFEDDILFYMYGGRIIHCAVYVGIDRVLHHWLNKKSDYYQLDYKKDLLKIAVRRKQ